MTNDPGLGDPISDDEWAELMHLLKDPQVREFLKAYLSVPAPDMRAHLRRLVGQFALARPSNATARIKGLRQRLTRSKKS